MNKLVIIAQIRQKEKRQKREENAQKLMKEYLKIFDQKA